MPRHANNCTTFRLNKNVTCGQSAADAQVCNSTVRAAAKHKPISKIGSVQKGHYDRWRVVALLEGRLATGPMRSRKSLADADLVFARTALTRTGMVMLLNQLKQIPENSKTQKANSIVCVPPVCQTSPTEGARTIQNLKKQNKMLEERQRKEALRIMKMRQAIKNLQIVNESLRSQSALADDRSV